MFIFDKRAFSRKNSGSKEVVLEQIHNTFTKLCNGRILTSFIKSAKKSDFVVRDAENITDARAMAALNREGTTLYINLICAESGRGRMLEGEIEEWAVQNGFKSVSLRAATRALIRVYERWGFKRVDATCTEGSATGQAVYDKDTSGGFYMSKCLLTETPASSLLQTFRDKAADMAWFLGF